MNINEAVEWLARMAVSCTFICMALCGFLIVLSHTLFNYPNLSREQTTALQTNQKFNTSYTAGINNVKAQLSDMQSTAKSSAMQQYNYLKNAKALSQTIADDIQRLQHANTHTELFAKKILQKELSLKKNTLKTQKIKNNLQIMYVNWKAVSDVMQELQTLMLTGKVQSTIQKHKNRIYVGIKNIKQFIVSATDNLLTGPLLETLGIVSDGYAVLDTVTEYITDFEQQHKNELAKWTDNEQVSRYSNKVLQSEGRLKSLEAELTTLYATQKEEYKQLDEITKVASGESYVQWGVLESQIRRTNQELLNTARKRVLVWKEMEKTKIKLANEQAIEYINLYHQNFLLHIIGLLRNTIEPKRRQIQNLPAIPMYDSAYAAVSEKVLKEYQEKYSNMEVKDLPTLLITCTDFNVEENPKTTQSMSDNQKVSDPAADNKQTTEPTTVSRDALGSPTIKEKVKSLVLAQQTQTLSSTKSLEISNDKELKDTFGGMPTTNSCKDRSTSAEGCSEGNLDVCKMGDVSLSLNTAVSTNVSPPSSQVKNTQSKPVTERGVELYGPK